MFSMLNNTCTLQTKTDTQSTTTGERVNTWANSESNIACRIIPLSSSKNRTLNIQYAKATHICYMRTRTVTINGSRIISNSITYDVVGIEDMGGDKTHIAAVLEKVST